MIMKPPKGVMMSRGHPFTKGLVGCWLMNEGSGNKVNDLSGNGNTGTITIATWKCGKFGPCLDFSGGGTITTGKTFSNRGLTFICWARNSTSDDGAVFGRLYSDLLMMTNRNSEITIYIGNGTNYSSVKTVQGLPMSGWHQYGWTVPENTAENIKIYHDGKTVASGVVDYSTTFAASIVPDTFNPFDEYLDNGMLFDRALSESEIAQLYANPFCMFGVDM